jgi:de-etiolated-1
MLITPIPSCQQYRNQEAKSSNGLPIQLPATVEQEKDAAVTAGPIVGIKQRLLAHLFRQASENPSPAKSLGLFYQQFVQYSSLVMWKMQLLDESHMLIKFGNVDGVVRGHQGDSASQQNAFFVVYNMYSTEVLGVYENSSREFAQTFEQFCEHFRACSYSEGLIKYRTTCSNNGFVREHLLKQKMAVTNARNGGEMQAVKRILSALPFSPQSCSESPYFDKSLFNYDEKLISSTERPKPCAEFPIKFYSRTDGKVQFKISPGIPDKTDRTKKFASYVFHPSAPFIISIQHSLFQAPVINFHLRN